MFVRLLRTYAKPAGARAAIASADADKTFSPIDRLFLMCSWRLHRYKVWILIRLCIESPRNKSFVVSPFLRFTIFTALSKNDRLRFQMNDAFDIGRMPLLQVRRRRFDTRRFKSQNVPHRVD